MTIIIDTESEAYYQEVLKLIQAVEKGTDPEGGNVKTGLYAMAAQTATYAAVITHRDTATLYRSYEIEEKPGKAAIYIDPAMINPRGERPAVYGPEEFARGGSHNAFGRAYSQANPSYVISGIEVILNGIRT